MNTDSTPLLHGEHHHIFLGAGHTTNERRAWTVIVLCSAMMVLEIGGGAMFGSLALVADGLHMSTHAAALLIAALAYSYARRHATDRRFVFGTGKLGDLAGFTSAIVLAMIALLIGVEAVWRFFDPVHINFAQAIPIAFLGLAVNIAGAWLLGGGHEHDHGHAHGPAHPHAHGHENDALPVTTAFGPMSLEIFETDAPPRFRLTGAGINGQSFRDFGQPVAVETVRPGGERQHFVLSEQGEHWQSVDDIPEPHEFQALLSFGHQGTAGRHAVAFIEPAPGHEAADLSAHRDNNIRAAFVHVLGDAAVSVLAILGLTAGRYLGWVFMDPVMGLVGAAVIAAWAYSLVRATSRILLDMNPDATMAGKIRTLVEAQGDRVADLHLWRLGPGHFGAILSVVTSQAGAADFYREALRRFAALSHVTIEVLPPMPAGQ